MGEEVSSNEIVVLISGMQVAFEVVSDIKSTQKEAFDAIDRIRKYRGMIGELTT